MLAVDRIVEEFGTSPAYANIASAVAAAADGDRIIIKNRTGDIPWIENITVDKSLEFLNYADNGFFVVQGNWTIIPAAGRVVVIKGMRNTNGSITATGAGTLGGTALKVLDGQFVSGNINAATDAVRAEIVGNELQFGYVRINLGNVVGNKITYSGSAECIRIVPGTGTFQGDTCAVIGNWVDGQQAGGSWEGIYINGRAQAYHIRNNWVRHGWMGIELQGGNDQAVANLVQNNSIVALAGGSSSRYGISIANTYANSIWEVMNNAIGTQYTGTNRGINRDSGNNGQINVYYNHVSSGMSSPISTGFTFEGNNTTDQPLTFNADGTLNNAPAAVNGGNPAAPFYDLDLTIGDAGAYGGSYTMSNFFPLHTGAARVYMTGHPFNLRTGSTLRVRANAWDR
ncbi:MAG: hypothetical protein KF797_04170 [Flavobacteriales bacterium]|nr:hypothetical protein [Flavobacteriales bacterium]